MLTFARASLTPCSGDVVWNQMLVRSSYQIGHQKRQQKSARRGSRPFQPGNLAAGRFRVVREIGRGAMGVICEAVDERLDQRRALKCARPGFQERLPPEACAAMRVTHD